MLHQLEMSTLKIKIVLIVSILTAMPFIAVRSETPESIPKAQTESIDSQSDCKMLLPNSELLILCSTTLPAHSNVEQRLFIEGAIQDLSLDCQGATLQQGIVVRSLQNESGQWQVPRRIDIKNCVSQGMIHVYGPAINGEGPMLTESSRRAGHSLRTRLRAPSYIHFDRIELQSHGAIPVYFGPGVNHSAITNSHIRGQSASVAIYLDAESSQNLISGNVFDIRSRRELIALDGSAYNRITGNRFVNPIRGGIFLYRNCGEGGNIRHQSPSYNLINNNRFEYASRRTRKPSIWLGSRNGNRRYCDKDKGYPFGSSSDDKDHAIYNLVMRNEFINRMYIRSSDSSNLVLHNQLIRVP